MVKTTTGICLTALLLSCSMNSMLLADELIPRDEFFTADEAHHKWINESDGRTGLLVVNGALLSSPCTLETNEVGLSLPQETGATQARYILKVHLAGCGEGGGMNTTESLARRESPLVMQSVLLTGVEDGILRQKQQVLNKRKMMLHGGVNQITYHLDGAQYQAMIKIPESSRGVSRNHNAILRLHLYYE